MSLETPTYKSWLNVPAKSREVVRHHSAPEWLRRALYQMILGGVAAVVASVWIFFPTKAVSVLPPGRLLHLRPAGASKRAI
jgi:hypothetical protein